MGLWSSPSFPRISPADGSSLPEWVTDNAGTLHFSRVTRDDAGNYTCIASNGLQGQIRAHVQLTVAGATVPGVGPGLRPAPRQPHCSLLPAPRRALPIQCSSPSRWSRSARPCTRATRPCCGVRPRGTPSRSFSGRARIASWTPPSSDPGRPSPPPHPTACPAAQAPGASQVGNAGASLPAGCTSSRTAPW